MSIAHRELMKSVQRSILGKAQPSAGSVHTNRPLANLALAFLQEPSDFVALDAFPIVRVRRESDKYAVIPKGNFTRTFAAKRAPGDPSAGGGYAVDLSNSYSCQEWAVHRKLPWRVRENADEPLNLPAMDVRFTVDQIRLALEIEWFNDHFKTGAWTTDRTGVASGTPSATQFLRWENSASEPVDQVEKFSLQMELTGLKRPNMMIVGPYAHRRLLSNASIKARLNAGANRAEAVTPQIVAGKLAELFQVKRYLVAKAKVNTAAEGQTDSMRFVASDGTTDSALLLYVPDAPAMMEPAAGYTFMATESPEREGGVKGMVTRTWDELKEKSTYTESEVLLDMKLTAADCGLFLADAATVAD